MTALSHKDAIDKICAAGVVLSYEEAIDGYLRLRGLDPASQQIEAVERFAAALWRHENPDMSVFECDGAMKERYRERALAAFAPHSATAPFQQRVQPWMLECFGPEISADVVERNHRFLEEALELIQTKGMTRQEAHQLVNYVFDRPSGDPVQEVGGVMVTLAALCLASDMDMHDAGEAELARVWTKVEKIRAKQAAKPKHSALPVAETQHPVTLTYTNWREETAERTIVPLYVRHGSTEWHPEPQWLLGALDIEKNALREFALKDFGQAAPRIPINGKIGA